MIIHSVVVQHTRISVHYHNVFRARVFSHTITLVCNIRYSRHAAQFSRTSNV